MTKEEYESFNDNMNAELQGIGISVVYNSERQAIEIVSVMNNSPALENGLKAGDLIFIVEGQAVAEIGYNAAMEITRGEAGTVFNFSVMRPKDSGYEILEFSVKRGYITEETVTYKLYSDNVGMVRISSFDKKTPEQFKAAIESLIGQGANKFVFDVRYNPGGNLESICEILDMLVPKGPVIRIIDRYGNESTRESDENELNYPIAVITNGSTASAAELFTATLRDYKKAVIIGEKTFGKGVMQSVFSLSDGSAICITTQTYCPPFSESYDKIGISPDSEVKLPEEYANISIYKLTLEQDTQLKAAVEAVK